MKNIFFAIAIVSLSLIGFTASAQRDTASIASSVYTAPAKTTNKKSPRTREFYFSWGYNSETYTQSNIKVNQPGLGNSYILEDVSGHDHKGWDEGLFRFAFTIPQYNYRFGLIVDKVKDWGFEINFDHTKFIAADQHIHLVGALDHRAVDTLIYFAGANGFYYYLNNGANFLLFNFVKRWHWIADKSGNVKVDLLGKVGVGPLVPHVQNAFFTNDSTSTEFRQPPNDPQFQLGGWNVGVEAALRCTFFKYAYLEYCNKVDYARYSHLEVWNGRAKQAFGTYEEVLNIGLSFPVGKR